MIRSTERACIAFVEDRRIAYGSLSEVAAAAKRATDEGERTTVLVVDATTSEPVELDLHGSVADVRERYSKAEANPAGEASDGESKRSRGRPRLGVVSKEVTLLPRHWAWLGAQRGGASATLRRLVEQARKEGVQGERTRKAQDATYRFMYAALGNQPGFEEAARALYANDAERFSAEIEGWPPDLRDHCRRLAAGALPGLAQQPVGDQ